MIVRPKSLATLCVLIMAVPSDVAAQPVRNGGFERRDGARTDLPADWRTKGPGYQIELDPTVARGNGVSLRIKRVGVGTFANGGQALDAAPYRGHRVAVSGYVRTDDVRDGYAGVWLRIDAASPKVLFFDNMAGRGATDSMDWTRFEAIGVVDNEAVRLVYGPLLTGSGTAWFDDIEITSVPIADLPPPSKKARQYLERAIDLVQANALRRDFVDWTAVRRGAIARAAGAKVSRDTYPAIQYVLASLGDGHSALLPPALPTDNKGRKAQEEARAYGLRSSVIGGRIGYVSIPSFGTGPIELQGGFAEALQRRVAKLDETARCGWVVDLRENEGGNMWPMLAGIGPVLGEGEAGAFVSASTREVWGYNAGSSWSGSPQNTLVTVSNPHALRNPAASVAVLTGPSTASSGEAIVVAFRNRPNTRSFGAATRGLSTANEAFPLSDGATIVLTISVYADRTAQTYGSTIAPDEILPDTATDLPLATDPVVARATKWLMGRKECKAK